jgi:AcrR family transcriptional regulator
MGVVVGARGAAREAAICDAALELLAEVGYDRMSMDAVATRAHASKATIYRHWPGKYELVLNAVRSRAAGQHAPVDTGSLRGDLLTILRALADGIGAEDAALLVGALRAMRAAPELGSCMRDQMIEDKRSLARAIVARAVARGELPPEADPDLLHEVAPSLVFFRLLISGRPVDEPFLEHVVDDVLIPLLTYKRATRKASLA